MTMITPRLQHIKQYMKMYKWYDVIIPKEVIKNSLKDNKFIFMGRIKGESLGIIVPVVECVMVDKDTQEVYHGYTHLPASLKSNLQEYVDIYAVTMMCHGPGKTSSVSYQPFEHMAPELYFGSLRDELFHDRSKFLESVSYRFEEAAEEEVKSNCRLDGYQQYAVTGHDHILIVPTDAFFIDDKDNLYGFKSQANCDPDDKLILDTYEGFLYDMTSERFYHCYIRATQTMKIKFEMFGDLAALGFRFKGMSKLEGKEYFTPDADLVESFSSRVSEELLHNREHFLNAVKHALQEVAKEPTVTKTALDYLNNDMNTHFVTEEFNKTWNAEYLKECEEIDDLTVGELWRSHDFGRDEYCKIFGSIFNSTMIDFDQTIRDGWRGNRFHCWFQDDSLYILDTKSGKMLEYYKHLGRSAQANWKCSKEELAAFLRLWKSDLIDYGEYSRGDYPVE